jgi:alkanesulfonate monooxygenase SsuD/methylene tetrahydromethanopterin reductase-like flavin-dependent oxidoreductase (luciferase family)
MRTGVFFFGGVEMDDAGPGPPAASDRRYTQQDFWHAQERLLDMGVRAEALGFDIFWLTEHHFQYEGYEVVPNAILFGAFLAGRTSRIKIGALFNIVPQWHPLRLAEDFAVFHNLSGGRGILGVGRGTVPREIQPLTNDRVSIGSFDNPEKAADDALNREIMDESMRIVELAFEQERFAFHGKHFQIPPPGIPDRGGTVQHLTLVPRPKYPYEIWQAITSPPTLEWVPRMGYGGVFWNMHYSFIERQWNRFGEVWEEQHGKRLGRGEKRMLVLNVRIEDTHEEAWRTARPGHDEFWKFLGPYGWSRGYRGADGKPVPPGLVPTLEESIEQKNWIIGTAEEVAEGIQFYRELLGVEELCIFPNFPGDSYDKSAEQMARYARDVMPLLEPAGSSGVRAGVRAAP